MTASAQIVSGGPSEQFLQFEVPIVDRNGYQVNHECICRTSDFPDRYLRDLQEVVAGLLRSQYETDCGAQEQPLPVIHGVEYFSREGERNLPVWYVRYPTREGNERPVEEEI